MTARSIKADIDLKNEQAKSLALQNAMDALDKDPVAKAAASRLVSSVKTTDYKSFEDWYAAVREHAGDDSKYVDNPTVQNYALAWYERIGNSANVHANIEHIKAATRLTEQQVKTEFERTGLTKQQAETAAKDFERLSMQVDEFTRFDSVQQRYDAQKLNAQILQFARDIKMDERDISAMEKEIKQGDYYMDTSPVSQPLRAWEYVLTHAVQLRGLFK
ncbi:hypothetical protein [Microviridae sp.]|nr:hypothetical protein [Microviridae sp.]